VTGNSRAGRNLARGAGAVGALLALLLTGCSDPAPALLPVPAPATSGLEPSVIRAVQQAQARFERIAAAKPGAQALAEAYGELAMTYHAQSLLPPAEAAYADARLLAPGDARWPYLLGHLYNDSSRVPEALRAFESALALDRDSVPILFSLGESYLQHGDLDAAQTMYDRLSGMPEARAAALTGLGKVALAKHQYVLAVTDLEEALQLWPSAARLRQPLATAYQGLGQRAKAEEVLRQYSVDGFEPEVADPLADSLGAKVAASRALLRRGQRFGRSMRFDLAEPAFRAALEADPGNAEAAANLGVALANLDRLAEARDALAQSLRLDGHSALAHLSLGVVQDRLGADDAAGAQYAAALALEPANADALVYLADLKMRTGRPSDAQALYGRALALVPGSSRIVLSLALAQVKAGRYGDARRQLEDGLKAHPQNREIANALVRILATAPDAAVRSASEALQLGRNLFESTHNPADGEAYAMALAESGSFDQAVLLQRETMIVLEHTDNAARKPFAERNLHLYEQHRAAREGWAADDPGMQPRSPAARRAKDA
jgi:tetratricopeptide (TPR) repeat protein